MILHKEFIRVARRFSKKTAISDHATGKNVPYSRALIGSLILSKKILKSKDQYIGIMVPTSAGCMLANIGVLMAGKIPVMINYSTGAAENTEYAQYKCGFTTVITSRALLEKIRCPLVKGMIFLEDIMAQVTFSDKINAVLRAKLPVNAMLPCLASASEDDTAVILFTSGSEKEPKAVQLSHKNLSSNVEAARGMYRLTEKDIFMAVLPLFHVFGLTTNFWLPLLTGMKVATYPNPLDYKTVPGIFREEKATIMAGTPVFFRGYLKESNPGDFDSAENLVVGADKAPDSLRKGYMDKHGKVLFEGYGTTETSPIISTNIAEANRPGSIGKVIPGVEVKIAELDTGAPLKAGETGKILVKGPNVMKGYYDDLEETSLRIRDGWYDTGDMGMLDEDGFLWHKGRLKRFVKIGGEMVSLVRTETVLESLLADEVECCIVEVPDPKRGAKLVAALTHEIDQADLVSKMGKQLPLIAVPKEFIVLEEMPKMGSGKIDFRTVTDLVRKSVYEKEA